MGSKTSIRRIPVDTCIKPGAFDELGYEGRNPAFRLLKHVQEKYEGGRTVTREGGYVQ